MGSPELLFPASCTERTFGVWKARLPIPKRINNYLMENQVKIPLACAVLHNFIFMMKEGDELLQRYCCDATTVLEIDPPNTEPNDVNDIADSNNSNGQDGTPTQGRTDMARFRNALTALMAGEYVQRPGYRSRLIGFVQQPLMCNIFIFYLTSTLIGAHASCVFEQ